MEFDEEDEEFYDDEIDDDEDIEEECEEEFDDEEIEEDDEEEFEEDCDDDDEYFEDEIDDCDDDIISSPVFPVVVTEIKDAGSPEVSPINEMIPEITLSSEIGTDEIKTDVLSDNICSECFENKDSKMSFRSKDVDGNSQPLLKGKKYALITSVLLGLLTLDDTGILKTVGHAFKYAGFSKTSGDGTDGYTAYAEYVRTQAIWETAQKHYANVSSKTKDDPMAMLEEMETLRAAKIAFTAAKKHFTTELTARQVSTSPGDKELIQDAATHMVVPFPKTNEKTDDAKANLQRSVESVTAFAKK